MELRIRIDEKFMEDIQAQLGKSQLGAQSGVRITQDALALYKWAVEEAGKGRVILSTNSRGEEPHRVIMPSLSTAKKG